MRIIKAKDYDTMSKKAAIIIGAQMLKKTDSVLGFATGDTPLGTYAELVRLYKESILDFSGITTFNLDEYFGCATSDRHSYHYFMHENLFRHINLPPASANLPDGGASDGNAEAARYEQAIDACGGIDLQLLGIGLNGHIGFNEPDDFFAPATHLVQLTDSTIDANARLFNSRDEVPTSALSMGIGTIMRAKSILMLISGQAKKEIAERALFGPVTPRVPASILQYHPDCTVILAVD